MKKTCISIEKQTERNKVREENYYYIQCNIIPHVLGNCPFIPNALLGRQNEIEDIKTLLFGGNNILFLFNEENGVGTTTVASSYYHTYHNEYKHVAWVHCRKNISTAILSLSKSLGIEYDEKMPEHKRFKCLLQMMSSIQEPCLLIIDDANDYKDIINSYDNFKICSNFHILITTSITRFKFVKSYHVKELSDDQALALFREYYPMHKESEDALLKKIFHAVSGNTLVLVMLAKHLYTLNQFSDKYSLKNLLNTFQQKGLLLDKTNQVTDTQYQVLGGLHKENPADILNALFELAELIEPEKALLSIFAILPSISIAHNDLLKLLSQVKDLEVHLSTLLQKGWIDFNDETETYKCNPLVQELIENKKSKIELLDDCNVLIESLISRLEYEPGTGHLTKVSYGEAAIIVEYAECILQFFQNAERSISVLCERIGRYHATVGNLCKALEYYEECTKLKKELFEEYPKNIGFKFGLAISYSQLGTIYKNIGNISKTLMCFQEDTKLTKELYEECPNSIALKNGLAMSYSQLGSTYKSTYDFNKALEYYEKNTNLKKELYEEYPNNTGFKNGLAISYSKLGAAYKDIGNLTKALEYFQEETKLFIELYEANPTNIRTKNALAISYSKLGLIYRYMNDSEKALKYFLEDNKLTKELCKENPGNVGFKNGLAISYSKLGTMHKNNGDLDKALECFEEYSKIKKELYEECPDFVGFKNGLAISYSKLGSTYKKMGDLNKALEYYEKYIQLKKELQQEYPDNIVMKNGLAIAYYKIGMFYKDEKKSRKKAYNYFVESENILINLIREIPQANVFPSFLEQVEKKMKSLWQ